MNFYNSRDFRVETSLNLLERFGCIRKIRENSPKHECKYEVIFEPPKDILSEKLHRNKVQAQNQKLLKVMEYSKLKTCRRKYIYEYFGQDEARDCGFCDICKPNEAII